MPITPAVTSPCIKICELNQDRICIGCGRSLDEIAQWSQAADPEKQRIVTVAHARLEKLGLPHATTG